MINIIHNIKSLEIKSAPVLQALIPEQKETVDECIERKIPIIMEENPTMEEDQAYAIARAMCMESTITDSTEGECKGCACNESKKQKEKGDCPMDDPDCPNYEKSLPLIELDELMKKVDSLTEKVDTLIKENNSEEKVETDLRERKMQILRRAVSKYLKEKSNNSEV